MFSCMVSDPKGPGLSSLQNRQAGLPWLPGEEVHNHPCALETLSSWRTEAHWLENGKEKWEFLQAAKQQAITSQVRRHPSWRSGRIGAVCGAHRTIILSIMKTAAGRFYWNSHSLLDAEGGLGEWSKASAHGAASRHLSLMPARAMARAVSLPHLPASAPVFFPESLLSRIHLNPVYSSSPNNYCQTLPCQISPNSSHYSPCFHHGL